MTASTFPRSIRVVDSHTEGEPTRVVVEGWPQPEGVTMMARRDDMRTRFDHLRAAVVCEPRGHDAIVGALITPPVSHDSTTGVIFFNNVGYLGMCGHGLIGVVRTLAHMGRIAAGVIRVDTPAGVVSAELHEDGQVTIANVPSWCHARDVRVDVPGMGEVKGDVAYGGNWFFIAQVEDQPLLLSRLTDLNEVTLRIRAALAVNGITGRDGGEIDHIELYEPTGPASARNFVMCPGGAYDRSPCGTGTSAKLAVLHAAGAIAPGEVFVQESITGGRFTAWLESDNGELIPRIRGSAHITADTTLYFDPADPFIAGFTAAFDG